MRWVLLVMLVGCSGTTAVEAPAGPQHHWTGQIDTSAGNYTASLFIGGGLDAGYYSANVPGLSGAVAGALPSVTIRPDRCDGGFPATIALTGDAAVISYSGATCAGSDNGSGTLWRY